jgi:two-component system response regulator MprA
MPKLTAVRFVDASPSPAPVVVVVDDDPTLVETLEAVLGEEGYAVEGFTDPAAALVRLRLGPAPDLILSDCIMPGLTGAELCDALAGAGVETPVLLMTALADPSFCVHTDRITVLNKPFEIDDLLAEIEATLRPASGPRRVSARRARAG